MDTEEIQVYFPIFPKTMNDVANYMKNVPYASTFGSLMDSMVATRLDIAHAMRVVSRFMAKSRRAYPEAIKSIF